MTKQNTPELIRPEALAIELGVSGKLVRAYLRKHFTRNPEAKNTAWVLEREQADAVREHFIARRAIAKAEVTA